jgi:uncharacterized protein YheU (UPF0270 family)
MIVLGKLADVEHFADREGCDVYQSDMYSEEENKRWLLQALQRGDDVLLVKPMKLSGQYAREVAWLIEVLDIR